MTSRTYLSIGDVLTLLREEFPDVTISKIRFLESQGLVNPERSPSGYRKFFEHDVERLRWVLRQQREHFLPLKVIRDRLADGDLGDDAGTEQPNGKTAAARPRRSPSPASRRATRTSSRPRPTKRRWRAFSPTRRVAPHDSLSKPAERRGLQVVAEVEVAARPPRPDLSRPNGCHRATAPRRTPARATRRRRWRRPARLRRHRRAAASPARRRRQRQRHRDRRRANSSMLP